MGRLWNVAIISGSVIAPPAWGQCPDGTPPPCRAAPQPAEAAADAPTFDSSTALVVPLTPVGADTSLRSLAATFAAIVAQNLTVGDVKAAVAHDLGDLLVEDRAEAARRQQAGAFVDGTLLRIGNNVRATVRLVSARRGRDIVSTTVTGSPDSLLALADQASVVLLKAWWKRQPGPYERGGLTTSSLPALRHYIGGVERWRHGTRGWRALLDSAVTQDPDLMAAWIWLAIPAEDPSGMLRFLSAMVPSMVTGTISSDSARHMLRLVSARLPREAWTEMQSVATLSNVTLVPMPPPTPAQPRPHAYLDMFEAQTVEGRYLNALTARYAALAGAPDTVALALARSAVALDSSFVPASKLLFALLVDAGDSAGARAVLEGEAIGSDSDLAAVLAARHADTSFAQTVTDADRLGAAGVLAPQWHRFATLRVVAPALRRLFVQQVPEAARATMAGPLALMLDYPLHVAEGRIDSARSTAGQFLGAAGANFGVEPVGTTRIFVTMSLLGRIVPPTRAFFPDRLDSLALDSIVTAQAGQGISRAAVDPATAEMVARMQSSQIVGATWVAGVLAVQAGDHSTARYAAAVLDSLAASDSVTSQPLALGLRAELALATDRGAVAESLLVQAIAISVTNAPARYRWLLAQRYANTDHPELARRMAHSLTVPSQLHGMDHVAYYPRALKLEAEMLLRLAEEETELASRQRLEAIAKFREYVELRAEADPDLQPEVGDAHARLARLLYEGDEYEAAWHHVHEAQDRGVTVPTALLDSLRGRLPEPVRPGR